MMDIPRADHLVLVGFLEMLENLDGKSSMDSFKLNYAVR